MPSRSLRSLVPTLALVLTSASAGGAPATPSSPASPLVDASLPRPSGVEVQGANETHALLKLEGTKTHDFHYAILDLQTSCLVETHAPFPRLEALRAIGPAPFERPTRATMAPHQARAAAALADPATRAEITRYVSLARRFGMQRDSVFTSNGDLAWSPDGTKILAFFASAAFRSRDGGQSYELVEANTSRAPYVTRDGRYAFFRRCADPNRYQTSCSGAEEIAFFETGSSAPPRRVPLGRGSVEGLDPTGEKLVVVRDHEPGKLVVDHLDPTTGAFTRAFTVPAPPLPSNHYFTIDPSRGGRFGAFHHWVDASRARIDVIDMTSGKIVSSRTERFVGTEVDDEGRLAWGTVNLVRAMATTRKGASKVMGAGDRAGWAPGGRLVVFDFRAPGKTIGGGCGLVRVARVGD